MESTNDRTHNDGEPNAESLSQQAGEHLTAGRFEEASTLYERALALDAQRVNDWINRGLALWSLSRNEAALECYDRALALDPRNALGWMNRGNALHALERHDEVLESYDRALEIDPYLARAWFNKGDALGRQSHIIEAKACFENARDLGRAQSDEEVAAQAIQMVNRCDEILMNEYYG